MLYLTAHHYECSHCNKNCATERLLRDHMRQHGRMVLHSIVALVVQKCVQYYSAPFYKTVSAIVLKLCVYDQ